MPSIAQDNGFDQYAHICALQTIFLCRGLIQNGKYLLKVTSFFWPENYSNLLNWVFCNLPQKVYYDEGLDCNAAISQKLIITLVGHTQSDTHLML